MESKEVRKWDDDPSEKIVSESQKEENIETDIEGLVEEEEQENEEIDALRQEVDEWRSKANEHLDKYLRGLADFSNYRKRQERAREQQFLRTRMDILKRLVPVIDDFDRALANVPDEFDGTGWVEGVTLIANKLKAVLEGFEVVPIEALGRPFDPNFHSALAKEPSDQYPEGTVSEEVNKGYMIGDLVLRPAEVKVSSGTGIEAGTYASK